MGKESSPEGEKKYQEKTQAISFYQFFFLLRIPYSSAKDLPDSGWENASDPPPGYLLPGYP